MFNTHGGKDCAKRCQSLFPLLYYLWLTGIEPMHADWHSLGDRIFSTWDVIMLVSTLAVWLIDAWGIPCFVALNQNSTIL